jgi:hypothetical protein
MAQPEKIFKQGGCIASVFVNDVVHDGHLRQMRSVSFQKRYLDKNGEWQSTSHLNVNDLPKAALVLNKAYEYITSVGVTRENGEDEDEEGDA